MSGVKGAKSLGWPMARWAKTFNEQIYVSQHFLINDILLTHFLQGLRDSPAASRRAGSESRQSLTLGN